MADSEEGLAKAAPIKLTFKKVRTPQEQTFEAVRKPNLVQQEIYRAMEAGEAKNFRRMGEATASAISGGDGPTIPEQIEQLDALRRAGTITDEEFETKKRELLDRM